MTTLAIMLTDGRPYILETLPAWRRALPGLEFLVVDDSGDPKRREWITEQADYAVWPGEHRGGYTRAMQTVMGLAASGPHDYTFLLEDDFLPVDIPAIAAMQAVLDIRPHLCQVVLRRQPWYANEVAAGGVMEALTTQRKAPSYSALGHEWVEHTLFWSNNPCLFPRRVAEIGWPDTTQSERAFGRTLVQQGYAMGYWGKWGAAPQVDHIGVAKVGEGY